ncbi:hypothetical protein [Cylindrospermum sp. FACHB-282]|uniref:hypothetical protein n=1 Tax=Cylindrospermum sp. FACHB-282 TaxID=2692794 RepID=UPI001685690C|nr:hypothetical protein [Cylindrospermum sp. FACHB-282]MBD2383978.1 hypothetical protein [Cylindrospermum sp. FACHB-282]
MFLRKNLFWLPSLAAIAVLGSGLSADAQTVDKVSNQPLTEPTSQLTAEPETQNPNPPTVSTVAGVQQFPDIATKTTPSLIATPVPGTVATSSAALTSGYTNPTSQSSAPQVAQPQKVAQSDIDVGRATRGGRSYIGVAGNIGLSGGDSALGDGNFTVISKVGLTNAISVRPSAILADNTTILIPITYDLSLRQGGDVFNEPLPIAPYVGVGAAIKTGDNSQVAFLVSGGIDVPLNAQFTATAAVNAGFFDKTDVGLLLGVGYNFTGF